MIPLNAAMVSAALLYLEMSTIVNPGQASKLTDRQRIMRKALSNNGGVAVVAAVRHIKQDGRPIDGTIYHFNVPHNMPLHGVAHVVVPGRGNRLVVAEVVRVAPAEEYPHATEWVVSIVGESSTRRYIAAEVAALDDARARREISTKKRNLVLASNKLQHLRGEHQVALAALGAAVLSNGTAPSMIEERARSTRDAVRQQEDACGVLQHSIFNLESRLK